VGEMRNAYKMLVGKYEGKRPRSRPRHRWMLEEIWKYGGKVWTGFIWLRIGSNGGLLWKK
jgi:hypothetical protein